MNSYRTGYFLIDAQFICIMFLGVMESHAQVYPKPKTFQLDPIQFTTLYDYFRQNASYGYLDSFEISDYKDMERLSACFIPTELRRKYLDKVFLYGYNVSAYSYQYETCDSCYTMVSDGDYSASIQLIKFNSDFSISISPTLCSYDNGCGSGGKSKCAVLNGKQYNVTNLFQEDAFYCPDSVNGKFGCYRTKITKYTIELVENHWVSKVQVDSLFYKPINSLNN